MCPFFFQHESWPACISVPDKYKSYYALALVRDEKWMWNDFRFFRERAPIWKDVFVKRTHYNVKKRRARKRSSHSPFVKNEILDRCRISGINRSEGFQDCYKYVTISLRVYFSLFLVVTLCVCIEFSRWKIIFVLILYIMEHWRNEKRRISKVMKYNIFIFYRMHCFRWVWMETLLDLSWSKTREGVMGLI